MTVSVVDICNMALEQIGGSSIISLEQDSTPAKACARFYAANRDAVLRAYPWNCATERDSLAAATAAPAWGYAYQYQLPVDSLRVLQIADMIVKPAQRSDGTGLFKIEKRWIRTDIEAPLPIVYIERIEDPALFDPMLVEVLAARLAASIAYRVTGSQSATEAALQVYRARALEARSIDAQEGAPDELRAGAEWLEARL